MVNMIKMQMGKSGLTAQFIEQIKKNSANVENIRISVLKSACRDREELKEMNKTILARLGPKFTSKVIGYTIILKKWRRARAK